VTKRWIFRGHDAGDILKLSEQTRLDPLVSNLLWARGLTDTVAIKYFLEAKFSELRDPELLPGVDEAAKRILQAI
jgi:single-stranded-DNA-specific exonuclease